MSAFFSSFKDVVDRVETFDPKSSVLVTEAHTDDLLNEYRDTKQLVKSMSAYMDWATANTGTRETLVYETMGNVRKAVIALDKVVMEYKIDSVLEDDARYALNRLFANSIERITTIIEESLGRYSVGIDDLVELAEALPSHYNLTHGTIKDGVKAFESFGTRSSSQMLLEMVTSA